MTNNKLGTILEKFSKQIDRADKSAFGRTVYDYTLYLLIQVAMVLQKILFIQEQVLQ
jgi:hypothetical protein